MLRKAVTKIDDYSGGFVSKGSQISLDNNKSPDCVNVYSTVAKSAQKRKGYAKVITSGVSSGTAYGLYNFNRDGSTQFLMSLWSVSSAAALKRTSDAGTAWTATAPTAITAHANLGTTLTDAQIAYFTSYGTDLIITTEGRDVPQKHDSADTYPTLTTNYVDIDWETSHCFVVGDVSTYTAASGDKLKVTIDGTDFDNIIMTGDTTIALAAASINAHSGFAAKGFAWVDSDGYLRICSNTRGSAGSVVVADGSTGNGDEAEDLFDGATATGATITTNIAPSGKHNHVWYNYVWIANTSAKQDGVYYSASADPTTWIAIDYETMVTPGDVGITGMATLRGRMYVFKKRSIHRITYLGGTPLFDIKEVSSVIGTDSPRTILNIDIPNKGEMLIFLGTDQQLYVFDGYTVVPVSENVSTYNGVSTYCMKGDGSTYGINPAQLSKCHASNNTERHWYILFFPKDNDTSCKDGFIYDYYTNAFWPIHIDQDGNDVFHVSCTSDNAAGALKTYTAGAVNLWQFDSGTSDDGGNIDAYWTSNKMDMESEVIKKAIRNLTLTTSSSAATPLFSYRCDWSSSWTDTETLVASTQEHTFDVPRFDELIQYKFQDDSTAASFELIRASIVAQLVGIGK